MAQIHLGITLCDAHRADWPTGLRVPESLPEYAAQLGAVLGGQRPLLELHPTDPFVEPARYPDRFRLNRDNRWLNAVEFDDGVRDFIEGGEARLGLHQPLHADPLASNFFGKYSAMEETRRAMDFAAGLGAEYFVFHLAPVGRWDWGREDQMAKGLKVWRDLATYYRAQGYTFVPCVEVLEFPRFPATGGEVPFVLNECQKVLAETRIALNLGHLWRSRNLMLATGRWEDPTISFVEHLDFTLAHCWDAVHLFQLGGCWESETHGVPGLHPQQNPHEHPLKLRETPGIYLESGEIDLNSTLDLLLEYTVRRGRDLNLVLDIRDRDVGQVMEAARQIHVELLTRSEQH